MTDLEARLAALKERIMLVEHIDFDEPDSSYDKAFVAEVRAVLANRDLDLDELAELRRPYKRHEDEEFQASISRSRMQYSAGSHNKLWSVANKSEMRIDVIALDADTARQFAAQAGHVRAAENATVYRYNDDYVSKLLKDGSALGKALREGVPGVVEKRGANVVIGDRVFIPMTVV